MTEKAETHGDKTRGTMIKASVECQKPILNDWCSICSKNRWCLKQSVNHNDLNIVYYGNQLISIGELIITIIVWCKRRGHSTLLKLNGDFKATHLKEWLVARSTLRNVTRGITGDSGLHYRGYSCTVPITCSCILLVERVSFHKSHLRVHIS